jgi:hypothetical protein
LIEFGLLVLEEKILKYFQCIFTLFLLSPNPLHLNKLESPPPKDDLCQVWLKLTQWFWRRSQKCKSLQTDGRRDDGQKAIRIAHLSFQLRWAKNTTNLFLYLTKKIYAFLCGLYPLVNLWIWCPFLTFFPCIFKSSTRFSLTVLQSSSFICILLSLSNWTVDYINFHCNFSTDVTDILDITCTKVNMNMFIEVFLWFAETLSINFSLQFIHR